MARVQTSYQEKHNVGYAGMMVNPSTCDVDSFEFEGDTAGKFGFAVQRGSEAQRCKAGVELTTGLVGVLSLDKTLQPVQNDTFVAGDVASVIYRGVVWVPALVVVNPGDLVCIDPATGQITTGNPRLASYVIDDAGSGYNAKPTITVPYGEGYGANLTVPSGDIDLTAQAISNIDAPSGSERGGGFLREPPVTVSGNGKVSVRLSLIPIPGAAFLTSAAKKDDLVQLRLPGSLGIGS